MRATDPIIRLRVEDVLRVRLDGAEGWDVRRYVAEQEAAGADPWTVPPDGKPLSERQIRRYVDEADQLINESCRTSRKRLLRRHLAQRRALYARALAKGDERTALAALRDEAELLSLYDSELLRQLEELREQVKALTYEPLFNRAGAGPNAGNGAAAHPGTP